MDPSEKENLMQLILSATALVLLVVLAFSGLTPAAESKVNVETLVQDNSSFAIDLYRKLSTAGGNIFLSPFSVSNALAMTYAGARDNTQKQMASALKFSLDQRELTPAFGMLHSRLNQLQGTGNISLDAANSLWPKNDYKLLPEYLELVKRYYGVSITSLDYQANPEQARETINEWVAKNTRDKIKDIIPPGSLNAETRLVLANAIYFKGEWEQKFKADLTENLEFFLSSNRSVQTPMMTQTAHFRYAKVESLQILELPYIGNELSMLVLLPKQTDGLKSVENNLSLENLRILKGRMAPTKILVHIPKFEITSTFFLADTLASMGMVDAFSRKDANFRGIAVRQDQPLYLSSVIHKAFVEVSEEGTEASAATVADMASESHLVKPPEPPPEFRADHPFIFLIQENQTGSILFISVAIDTNIPSIIPRPL